MKNSNTFTKAFTTAAVVSAIMTGLPLGASFAASDGPVEPAVSMGITILPLDEHPVPDVLKTQAKLEVSQMKSRGYVDATEDAVLYLDKAREDKDKRLKPMSEVAPTLRVQPANLDASPLSQSVLLGATASGGQTDLGWTGLSRLFVVPKLGLVALDEVDYIASEGGMIFIKEAINQDINGLPAILNVKQSRNNKGVTELTWATDQKIYTLSTNRALKNEKAIDEFLAIARSIF